MRWWRRYCLDRRGRNRTRAAPRPGISGVELKMRSVAEAGLDGTLLARESIPSAGRGGRGIKHRHCGRSLWPRGGGDGRCPPKNTPRRGDRRRGLRSVRRATLAIGQAKTVGTDSPRDKRTRRDRSSGRQRRRVFRSRSHVCTMRFGFGFGIMLFKGIEEDDMIRDTRSPRNQGRGTDTRRAVTSKPRRDSFVDAPLLERQTDDHLRTIEYIRPDPNRPQGYEAVAAALRAVVGCARETQ